MLDSLKWKIKPAKPQLGTGVVQILSVMIAGPITGLADDCRLNKRSKGNGPFLAQLWGRNCFKSATALQIVAHFAHQRGL